MLDVALWVRSLMVVGISCLFGHVETTVWRNIRFWQHVEVIKCGEHEPSVRVRVDHFTPPSLTLSHHRRNTHSCLHRSLTWLLQRPSLQSSLHSSLASVLQRLHRLRPGQTPLSPLHSWPLWPPPTAPAHLPPPLCCLKPPHTANSSPPVSLAASISLKALWKPGRKSLEEPSVLLLFFIEHENAIYFWFNPHRCSICANLSGRSHLLFSSVSPSKQLTAVALWCRRDWRLIQDENASTMWTFAIQLPCEATTIWWTRTWCFYVNCISRKKQFLLALSANHFWSRYNMKNMINSFITDAYWF